MSPSWLTTLLASLFLFSQIFSCLAQVPLENTFKFVNEGELGPYVVEYRADYRVISIFNNPFQLCFYNTTPNAWTLALRMGTVRSESLMRWVWEANRGNPIKENATFTFGTNGNLVLADADGRIAWQTNTANKGVTGFKLLPNGNMVLHDSKGKFVWQSFNYPTDTLLVGQTLRLSGPNKLVSRASVKKNVNGPYSLVVQPKLFAIYNRTKLGVELAWFDFGNSTLESVKLNSGNQRLKLDYRLAKSTKRSSHVMAFTKYNTTLTYLRLEIDGNLKAYTFVRDEEADEFRWKVQKHAVREKSRLPDRKPLLENFQAMMPSSEQIREAGGEGEGSSSTTTITLAQSDDHHHHHQLSPPPQLSRYESQKRRDWNTFGQYLKNHKPPVPLPQCNYNHVLDFLRYLDQFGKTKVHLNGCVFFGQVEQVGPCTCPLKQAWGSLDALIGRLRAAYEENGGLQETNPFANSAIRIHLREVRDSQAKARGIPYKKKKKKRKILINSSNNNEVNSS